MNILYAFLISLPIMIVLDAVWLGLVSPKFYRRHIGFIMSEKPNLLAALVFYIVFILGVTVFVVYPGWQEEVNLAKISLLGSLFGLVAYATYDLTNQVTLKGWPFIVTLVDMAWGTVLTAFVSVASVTLMNIIF